MSIVAFKKKSMIQYGGQRSGKPPGGTWMMRGPFGNTTLPVDAYGGEGFSINGGRRSNSYIGKDNKFSSSGTPFRGIYPLGHGGSSGTYIQAQPVYNAGPAIVEIEGNGVWTALGYEAGTHQVKRVPATEAQGRIHTSTATVAVMAEPEETSTRAPSRVRPTET